MQSPEADVSPSTSIYATPVSHKNISPKNIVQPLGIPQTKKPDYERLYDMLIGLEMRIFNQENEMVKLKDLHAKEVKELKEQIKVSEDKINDLKEQVKTHPAHTDDATVSASSCSTINASMEKMKVDITELQQSSQDLKGKIEKAVPGSHSEVERKLHLQVERQEQYSRRESIRITGVPYVRGEVTNDIVKRVGISIGVHINVEDISTSHRTGKSRNGDPRPIICKFVSRQTKHQFLKNKKYARYITCDDRGNPVRIFIEEDLTPMRARVCKKLR